MEDNGPAWPCAPYSTTQHGVEKDQNTKPDITVLQLVCGLCGGDVPILGIKHLGNLKVQVSVFPCPCRSIDNKT
jgi:hypothetical protein